MQQSPPVQFEKCPKHPQNDIVLFCLSIECKEPLCKDCCKLHVHWHNQQGTQANLDTVDNVRQQLLTDVHEMKLRFEEERAILHHFSDSEQSEAVKQMQNKLQKVKQTLLAAVHEYCHQLEEQVKQRIQLHRQSHPGEKKELHQKLNTIINNLDQQEKMLLQPKYIRGCLMVMSEEQNHDFDQITFDVDNALKHYLSNAFDVVISEDKLVRIVQSFNEYVEIQEVNLREELDHYTKKIRENKKNPHEPLNKQFNSTSQKQLQPKESKLMQSIYDDKFRPTFQPGASQYRPNFNDSKADQIMSKFYH
ncbi:unnamed protein product [Paramecium octaurelia]|uniref:B box-type domain-containing protein n=1 Tax=Paramecium octaurelia TaxID=43137 RepID=A0A8S1WE10_PAROT|nr:unnamed protein product [Paramecium octaurelia]